ncbi:DUF3325 family protein [Sphingomonas sp.]|uniref:DUF3325 family protein n=1 Tax=Sphingomonas sp. TaxID=28214 RepID=UPI0031E29561
MTAIALILTTLAFALFGLATDAHHHKRLGKRPDAVTALTMRGGAWAALAAAFPFAIAAQGWVFGPILWVALLMLGAGLVFLALNLIPGPAGRK